MNDLETFLRISTICCGLLIFIIVLIINIRKGNELNLEKLLSAGIGGSSIPTGFTLIYCAFDSNALVQLSGLGVYVAFAGLSLVFIAFKTVMNQIDQIDRYQPSKSKSVDSENDNA